MTHVLSTFRPSRPGRPDYQDLIIKEKQPGNNKSPRYCKSFLRKFWIYGRLQLIGLISYKIVYHGQLHTNYYVDFFFLLEGRKISFVYSGGIFFALSFGEISHSMM